jgi:hypothetical protein
MASKDPANIEAALSSLLDLANQVTVVIVVIVVVVEASASLLNLPHACRPTHA